MGWSQTDSMQGRKPSQPALGPLMIRHQVHLRWPGMSFLSSMENHQVPASSEPAMKCSTALVASSVLACPLHWGWPQREPGAQNYTGVVGDNRCLGNNMFACPW